MLNCSSALKSLLAIGLQAVNSKNAAVLNSISLFILIIILKFTSA
jgi:hypothetical protein